MAVQRLVCILFLVGAASACARAHAKTVPQPPALEVPAPPPRVIVPAETEGPPVGSTSDATAQPPARRPPQRADAGKADVPPARTDPAKAIRPDQTTEPPKPPVQPDPAKAGVLETVLPGNQAEVGRTVRTQLNQANNDLKNLKRETLNADGKAQFDAAKRFIEQAEQAIKDRNLVYAAKLSDKAATLAARLAGR